VSDTEKVRPFIRASTKYRCLYINLATHDLLGKPPFYDVVSDGLEQSLEKAALAVKPIQSPDSWSDDVDLIQWLDSLGQ